MCCHCHCHHVDFHVGEGGQEGEGERGAMCWQCCGEDEGNVRVMHCHYHVNVDMGEGEDDTSSSSFDVDMEDKGEEGEGNTLPSLLFSWVDINGVINVNVREGVRVRVRGIHCCFHSCYCHSCCCCPIVVDVMSKLSDLPV